MLPNTEILNNRASFGSSEGALNNQLLSKDVNRVIFFFDLPLSASHLFCIHSQQHQMVKYFYAILESNSVPSICSWPSHSEAEQLYSRVFGALYPTTPTFQHSNSLHRWNILGIQRGNTLWLKATYAAQCIASNKIHTFQT